MFSIFQKPKSAVALYNTALDWYDKEQYQKALSELEKAELLDPEFASIFYTRGLCYQKLGKTEEAKEAFQATLKLSPEDVDALYNIARLFYNEGDMDTALAYAEQADLILGEAGDEWTSYLLGLIYEQQGQLEAAITAYEKSLAINPEQVLLGTFLAKLYTQLQQYDKAKALLIQLVELDPNNMELNFELALSLAKAGEWDETISYCRLVIQMEPNHTKAHNQLGLALYCTNKFEEAIDVYEKALELDPNYATAYNNLAYTYEKLGNYAKAIERFTAYLQFLSAKPGELKEVEDHIDLLKNKLLEVSPAQGPETAQPTATEVAVPVESPATSG